MKGFVIVTNMQRYKYQKIKYSCCLAAELVFFSLKNPGPFSTPAFQQLHYMCNQ